jgi:hypothetical protein
MDEIVLRSMLKWPNVPSVYGWLRLDRRGRWSIRMPAAPGQPEAAPRFERIVNPAVIEFIGRNYAHDAEGRYFFQNGPQRVFVALDYTPWIYSLDFSGRRFLTHTGASAGAPLEAYLDDRGGLIVVCAPGPGAVLDRDLPALTERLSDPAGHPLNLQALMDRTAAGHSVSARLAGTNVMVGTIRAKELAARFGFIERPAPPEAQPDC